MADREGDGVGYKRPPRHSQFRPGQSGNPTGRPKQQRNLATDLREELSKIVPIHENGKPRRVTKQRAFVKSLIQRAVNGDARAVTSLVTLCARTFLTAEAPVEQTAPADQELVEAFIRREAERMAAAPRAPKDAAPRAPKDKGRQK
jgi:hypothetical protein